MKLTKTIKGQLLRALEIENTILAKKIIMDLEVQ